MKTAEWFRYEDVRYAGPADEWGDPIPGSGHLAVELRRYEVIRETPKGVRLNVGYEPNGRLVLTAARKRFACPTVEEAAASFLARKQKQVRIYRARLKNAEEAIAFIKREAALSPSQPGGAPL